MTQSDRGKTRRRNSSGVNLLISVVFHGVIVLVLVYFAAREGLLGKELKKIAVEMVKETPPEPKKEEPPPEEIAQTPPETPPLDAPEVTRPPEDNPPAAPPPSAGLADNSAPVVAPPPSALPSFSFAGGQAVRTTSDPIQLYKGFIEFSLRSRWNRPTDMADNLFVAEVEIGVDPRGQLSSPVWKKSSGNPRWDASVREALAATPAVNRPPPTNFPSRVLVRFDVQEVQSELSN